MALLGIQKALIVDSDNDVSGHVVKILKRCGATEISFCEKLKVASIRLAAGEIFDVIIADIDVEEIGNSSVGAILAGDSHQGISHIPILFIARVDSRRDVQLLQDVGCYHFVMKPLNDNILEYKIKELALKKYDPAREQEIATQIQEAIDLKNYAAAEKFIKPALKRFPASIRFQVQLAELFLCKGDLRSCQSILSRALQVDPSYEPAVKLSSLLQGKREEAEDAKKRADEEAARQERFTDAQNLNTSALAMQKAKQYDKAIKLYEEALEKSEGMPTQYVIHYNAASAYLYIEDFEKVREHCKLSSNSAPLDYNKPSLLLARVEEEITKREAVRAAEEAQRKAEEMFNKNGTESAIDLGMLNQAGNSNVLLDPEEELRILKFIMFEGKY